MPNIVLAKNFTLDEFACKCCCGIEEDYIPELSILALALQDLRDKLNSENPLLKKYQDKAAPNELPIKPISGIRCPKHNKNSKGRPNSYHPKGCAADITCVYLPTEILYQYAKEYFTGCIYYLGRHFVHCDLRPDRKTHYVQMPDQPENLTA